MDTMTENDYLIAWGLYARVWSGDLIGDAEGWDILILIF